MFLVLVGCIQEKRGIATDLLEQKPALFLQRFGRFLSEDHLAYFDDQGDENYELGFYLRQVRQQQCKYVQEHRVKNRRFRAMQQMIRSEEWWLSYLGEVVVDRRILVLRLNLFELTLIINTFWRNVERYVIKTNLHKLLIWPAE